MEGGGPSPVAGAEALKAGGGGATGKLMGTGIKLLALQDLPPHVAEALRSLDTDGDGTIDVSELHQGAKEQNRAIAKSKFFRKLFILLFGIWLAQLASTFGVVFGVVNYAKARRDARARRPACAEHALPFRRSPSSARMRAC